MKLKKLLGLASVALASTVLLAACGGSSKSASDDSKARIRKYLNPRLRICELCGFAKE